MGCWRYWLWSKMLTSTWHPIWRCLRERCGKMWQNKCILQSILWAAIKKDMVKMSKMTHAKKSSHIDRGQVSLIAPNTIRSLFSLLHQNTGNASIFCIVFLKWCWPNDDILCYKLCCTFQYHRVVFRCNSILIPLNRHISFKYPNIEWILCHQGFDE